MKKSAELGTVEKMAFGASTTNLIFFRYSTITINTLNTIHTNKLNGSANMNNDIKYFLDWTLRWQSYEKQDYEKRVNITKRIINIFTKNNWLYTGIAFRGIQLRTKENKYRINQTIVIPGIKSWSKSNDIAYIAAELGDGYYKSPYGVYHGIIIESILINALDLHKALNEITQNDEYYEYYYSKTEIGNHEKEVITTSNIKGKIIELTKWTE